MSVTTVPNPSFSTNSTLITHDFWETVTPSRVIDKAIGQITIPALGVISANTLGIANQAAKLNYAAPNNFTVQLSSIPLVPPQNYNLVLRYTNPVSGQCFRYKLWNISTDPKLDVPCAIYAGQPIMGAAFSIEVWSLGSQQVCALLQPLVLNTSVLHAKCSLTDADTFILASSAQCGQLTETNGTGLIGGFISALVTSSSSHVVNLTFSTPTPNAPIVGDYISVSGNTEEPTINGIWQVTAFSGSNVTFSVTGQPGNYAGQANGHVDVTFPLPITFAACAVS